MPEARSTLTVSASNPQSIAAEAFSREILRLSADSDRLDGVWQIYKEECKVSVKGDYDFGREWFSLWDGTSHPTAQTANCQDVPASLIDGSETIRHDLIRARAVAQETGIGEATEVGVLKWHTLHWAPRK